MNNFFEMLVAAILISLYLIPVILALIVATFVANLFSALFKPITDPIHCLTNALSDFLPNPLESLPMFPTVKRFFGSTKNILFICFVIVFLVFHYLSIGNVDNLFDNISLLFPGSALEQVTTYGTYNGTLDISSFFVNPDSYLQTILFSFISGLFMHIGCTTKASDANVHILVKLLYTLLITLFSSIVLGMIPSDWFQISIPEISLDFISAEAGSGSSDIQLLWAELTHWGSILLENLVGIVPSLVAIYFLAHSISGFSAAFLGGFGAICAVALGWPEGLENPHSFQATFLLLFMLVVGEVIALMFGEMINKIAEVWVSQNSTLFAYYNVVSLLISYFFYPALALAFLCFISLLVNGFELIVFVLALVSLCLFSLATFAGYKITRWTSGASGCVSGAAYAVAMIFNIPIWLIYVAVFMA